LYLLLVLLLAFLLALVRVAAFALFVRLAIGLFGFLLVYRVFAERDCTAFVLVAEVFCILLLDRFAELAAVMELLRRAADEFALVRAALRSLLDAVVLEPAEVAPTAAALDPERLLPLVKLVLFDFDGSMFLAPYLE
jgi:hypothetical protein